MNEAETQMSQSTPEAYRILAVDDDEVVLSLYRDILCLEMEGPRLLEALSDTKGRSTSGQSGSGQGFDLTLCRTGDEAVTHAREALAEDKPYAVALIDVRLASGTDGLDAAARIRALDAGVEIVMVTGQADISLGELNRRVPPPEKLLYLQKPFKPQELRQLALSLCTKWHVERQYQEMSSILWRTVEERTADFERVKGELKQELAERTQMLTRLRISEERYRQLFDEDITGNFVASPDGRILACNEAFARAFGFETPSHAIGFAISDLALGTLGDGSAGVVLPAEGSVRNIEISYRRPDGSIVWLIGSFNGVFDEYGKLTEIRGYFYDITERRKLEERLRLAQKMEALGTLAGGIAHDFNNILGAILGYAEIVLDSAPSGTPLERRMQGIVTAGQRARDLVRQILNFSRQGGQERTPLHVIPLVKEALKLLRSSLPANIDIRLRLETSDDLVAADPTQMHQILLNLCTNAAHAMRDAGGLLEISLADEVVDEDKAQDMPSLVPGTYLRISVRDTGHGVKQEILDRIFDPFFTTKRPGEGTGMGLSVVHGIVAAHEGAVTVQSEPGKGTVFHVLLPKTDAAAETEPAPEIAPLAGGGRALFVDDESALVEIGLEMLKALGYEAEGFTDPEAALARFSQDPAHFDLVVLDQNMPRLTGLELAAKLNAIRPGIPVLLCTGFSEAISAESLAAANVSDLLMKPLLRGRLAESLHRLGATGVPAVAP